MYVLGTMDSTASDITAVSQASVAKLGVKPYFVLMAGGNAAAAMKKAQGLGMDAISSYVTSAGWAGHGDNHSVTFEEGIRQVDMT